MSTPPCDTTRQTRPMAGRHACPPGGDTLVLPMHQAIVRFLRRSKRKYSNRRHRSPCLWPRCLPNSTSRSHEINVEFHTRCSWRNPWKNRLQSSLQYNEKIQNSLSLREILGVVQVDEKGHVGNTAVVATYRCWRKHGIYFELSFMRNK